MLKLKIKSHHSKPVDYEMLKKALREGSSKDVKNIFEDIPFISLENILEKNSTSISINYSFIMDMIDYFGARLKKEQLMNNFFLVFKHEDLIRETVRFETVYHESPDPMENQRLIDTIHTCNSNTFEKLKDLFCHQLIKSKLSPEDIVIFFDAIKPTTKIYQELSQYLCIYHNCQGIEKALESCPVSSQKCFLFTTFNSSFDFELFDRLWVYHENLFIEQSIDLKKDGHFWITNFDQGLGLNLKKIAWLAHKNPDLLFFDENNLTQIIPKTDQRQFFHLLDIVQKNITFDNLEKLINGIIDNNLHKNPNGQWSNVPDYSHANVYWNIYKNHYHLQKNLDSKNNVVKKAKI